MTTATSMAVEDYPKCCDHERAFCKRRRVCKTYDFCDSVLCVHKCCPDGQSFVNGSHCKDTFEYGIDLQNLRMISVANHSDDFAVIHGYKSTVYIPARSEYHLDEKGNFYSYDDKIGNTIYPPEEETYCIEHATKNGITYGHTLFRIIQQNDGVNKKFLFNRYAMIISCVFLILTVTFYAISSERKKVFGRILMSFCIALFVLFTLLTYCTFKLNLNSIRRATCKTIGFLLVYMNISCFAWLQIMCYDIYWTFGSTKRYTNANEKRMRNLKRFAFYSIYGWGFPLVITLIPLTFHFVDVLPAPIKVRMAETKCLIERGDGNFAEILFYISPLSAMQLVSFVFFVKTVRYCLKVKGDIQKMNQSTDLQKKKNRFLAHKERLGLILKLSITMGIFFLFEVVSSFYEFKGNIVTEYIEIVWDFFNCLQGLFIFIIFICKKRNLQKCCKNTAVEKLRKISLSTARTTGVSLAVPDYNVQCSREDLSAMPVAINIIRVNVQTLLDK
ncbi:hypothetical protein NQ317_015996 [Molorchus minor]|uniref:G-protein coupled receptors family 2 profile 2 domain-containing protein n=1 Tax=Molorchus minor TaxID=1323400 RepID=A0ABQ9JLS1_9CUCU|nr:hypothetical protein NQ317_015996 [Molorchus minor]